MQSPDRAGSEPRRVHYNDDDDDGGHGGGSGGSVSGATEGSLDDVRSPRAVVGDEAADADAAAALGLPYFDVGTLRDELRAAFRELLREDEGGTAVYWFEEVEKRHGPHSWARVLVVGDEATYLAEPRTAGVARCLPHASLAGLHTCEEDPALLGVECPSQYDLLLRLPSEPSLQTVGGLLAKLAPGARHTHHGDASELAAALSLQRPDGYRAPFDVKLRRRAAAAAAATSPPQHGGVPSPTAADAVGDSKKRRLEHRRSMVGGAPALHAVPPLVAARNHWRTVGRAAAGGEVVAYVDELEERCAEVESQLAAMQEQASIEIEQLGEELSIKDSIAAEWTRRHSTLKARERQLELEVKRLGEAHDGLRTSLDEAESLAASLKQRSHILERENAALVRDKEAVRESLSCMTSACEGGGEPPYDTALSLTDAVKRALANSERLQDDNWRLVKQVAEMEKKLGATSRLKAAEPAAAAAPAAAAPQSDVDAAEAGGASPDSRLDVIDALESENAQVKKALHATQAAHEETKLREFDWEQKHAALLERHADVTQAQRSTVRGLERRLARLALNKPPEEQFSTRFSPDPPSPPTASFAPAGDEPSVGARVSTVMRGSIVTGTVKFVGMTDFAKGVWVGVALDAALGKHDGTIHGKEYFRCEQGCGVFLREDALSVEVAHCVRCLDGGGAGGGGGGHRRRLRMDSTAAHPHHSGGGGGAPSRAHASSYSPVNTSSRVRSQTAQGRSEQEEEYLRLSLTLRAQLDRATTRNASDKETIRLLQMNLAKANAIMSPTSQRWGRSPSKSAATECSDAGTAPDEGKRLPSASITRMSPVAPSMPPTP